MPPTAEQPGAEALATLIRAAYPMTAGVTLGAVEALAARETFGRREVAYLLSVMFRIGTSARDLADHAEVVASAAVNFAPRPSRAARIAQRAAVMHAQAELYRLRRGRPVDDWPGAGDDLDQARAVARAAFGWEATAPDPVFDRKPLKVRTVGGRLEWA